MNASSESSLWADRSAYRQQVRLAAVQVAGLSANELSVAIAYEVEPFSGIPAAEAEVVWKEAASEDQAVRVFDVAIARRKRRSSAEAVASRLFPTLLVLGALAVVAMAVDGAVILRRTAVLRRSLSMREPLEAELGRLAGETRRIRAEAAALRERRAAAVRAQETCARLRAAYPEALQALARACGGRAVVTSLGAPGEPFALTIEAAASSSECAAETLVDLTKALEACGWSLEPGSIVSRSVGSTVAFSALARRRP